MQRHVSSKPLAQSIVLTLCSSHSLHRKTRQTWRPRCLQFRNLSFLPSWDSAATRHGTSSKSASLHWQTLYWRLCGTSSEDMLHWWVLMCSLLLGVLQAIEASRSWRGFDQAFESTQGSKHWWTAWSRCSLLLFLVPPNSREAIVRGPAITQHKNPCKHVLSCERETITSLATLACLEIRPLAAPQKQMRNGAVQRFTACTCLESQV